MSHDALPSIIVFDVNETLLDITTLEPLFDRVFGDRAVLREWFAQLILYSQTMTLSGLYTPFGVLAVGSLRMVAAIHGVTAADSDIDELKKLVPIWKKENWSDGSTEWVHPGTESPQE